MRAAAPTERTHAVRHPLPFAPSQGQRARVDSEQGESHSQAPPTTSLFSVLGMCRPSLWTAVAPAPAPFHSNGSVGPGLGSSLSGGGKGGAFVGPASARPVRAQPDQAAAQGVPQQGGREGGEHAPATPAHPRRDEDEDEDKEASAQPTHTRRPQEEHADGPPTQSSGPSSRGGASPELEASARASYDDEASFAPTARPRLTEEERRELTALQARVERVSDQLVRARRQFVTAKRGEQDAAADGEEIREQHRLLLAQLAQVIGPEAAAAAQLSPVPGPGVGEAGQ